MTRKFDILFGVLAFLAIMFVSVLATRPAHAQQAVGVYTEQTGTDRAQIGVAPKYAVATVAGIANTIATGGVSQTVFNANPARAFLICQNPITATETLFINLGTAASVTPNGSFELAPGATLSFTSGVVYTGVIAATAATTGHYFACKQGS